MHATSLTLLRASSTALVVAWTGSCRSGPQHAPVPAGSSSSRPWSCCGRLPQLRGQTPYSSASADDDGFDGSDTIVLTPSAWTDFFPHHVPHRLQDQQDMSLPSLISGLRIPLPPASAASAPAPQPAPSQSAVASPMAAPATVTAPPDMQTKMPSSRRVPLVTERHHRLSISPVQRERTAAPGPEVLLGMGWRPAETAGLTSVSFVIPVSPLPPAGHHHRPNGWELIIAVQYAALVLRTTAGEALVLAAIGILLLPMPAVAAIPLPHTPNAIGPEIVLLSSVVLHWPAWLRDLPETHPSHPGAVLPHTRCGDHPRAIVRLLAPSRCPLIAAAATLHLGFPHLDLVGDNVSVLAVQAPGLLTGIVNNVCKRQTSIFYAFVTLLLFLHRMTTRRQIRIRQLTIPSYPRR